MKIKYDKIKIKNKKKGQYKTHMWVEDPILSFFL